MAAGNCHLHIHLLFTVDLRSVERIFIITHNSIVVYVCNGTRLTLTFRIYVVFQTNSIIVLVIVVVTTVLTFILNLFALVIYIRFKHKFANNATISQQAMRKDQQLFVFSIFIFVINCMLMTKEVRDNSMFAHF